MGEIEKRQRRGGAVWRARYRGPDGRRRSKTFARRSDAERWLAASTTDLARGDWADPKLGRMTFGDWVPRWQATVVHLRPKTRELNVGVARNYLLPRFGNWPLARITTSEVKAMLAEELAEDRLSVSAIRRHVLVLRSILDAAVADGRIARNPCHGVKLPAEQARPMRFLEPELVAVLVDAHPPHYRPLLLTAAYVGLRWGELAGLRVQRVDLLRHTIRVEEQLVEAEGRVFFAPPKTRAGSRTVTIPKALTEVLGRHFATPAVQESGLAFPAPGGGVLRRPVFQRVWRRACRDAGFENGPFAGLVFHELRHTAAALAIAQGAHPEAIKERLGHSSITVTFDRYGGLFPRLDQAIAERLDAVLRNSLAPRAPATTPGITHLRASDG